MAGCAARTQLAALCWRIKNGEVQVLLITSRETGRWVLPKGWPVPKRCDASAAAMEAWEEAGVRGKIQGMIGCYAYDKIVNRGTSQEAAMPCHVDVHVLEVQKLAKRYPESRQRRRKWFAPQRAAQLVDEPALSAILASYDPRAAKPAAELA